MFVKPLNFVFAARSWYMDIFPSIKHLNYMPNKPFLCLWEEELSIFKETENNVDMDSDSMISYSDSNGEPYFYMEEDSESNSNGAEMEVKSQFSLGYCLTYCFQFQATFNAFCNLYFLFNRLTMEMEI